MDATYGSVVHRTSFAALLVTAVVWCRSNSASAGDEQGGAVAAVDSVEQILGVWQQREARARRFAVEWIHERTYTKYWADCHVPFARDEYVTLRFGPSRLILDGERIRFDSGGVVGESAAAEFGGQPATDRFGRSTHDDARRVFRDDRIRYDGGRPRVDPREPATTGWPRNLRPFTTVFDGRRNLQFLPADHGREAEAYWFADAENRIRTSLHTLPVILSARPSWLGIAPESCRVEPAIEGFAGRECVVLIDEAGLRREFWLDPARDCIVLSYREECDVLGARMRNRIDIRYSRDECGDWWPAAWTTVFFDNHGLMEQRAPATVLGATTEPPVAADALTVEFPAGTWVFDEADGGHHIVGADRSSQPISRAELDAGRSHAELIARGTWAGRTVRGMTSAWQRAWVRFAVFATLLGGVSAWLRRRTGAGRR